jgi:class 3 adenylate cyclase
MPQRQTVYLGCALVLPQGSAVTRARDWLGSPINVASRMTSVGRPGSITVAESTRDEAGEAVGFTWSSAGRRRLKGVGAEVKLFHLKQDSASPVTRDQRGQSASTNAPSTRTYSPLTKEARSDNKNATTSAVS